MSTKTMNSRNTLQSGNLVFNPLGPGSKDTFEPFKPDSNQEHGSPLEQPPPGLGETQSYSAGMMWPPLGPGGMQRWGPLGPGGTQQWGPLGPGGTQQWGPIGPGGTQQFGTGECTPPACNNQNTPKSVQTTYTTSSKILDMPEWLFWALLGVVTFVLLVVILLVVLKRGRKRKS